MRKRYVPILTFTVAMLLVGSIAYAADRRKKTKQAADDAGNLSEEALKVELLSAGGKEPEKTSAAVGGVDKHLDELSDISRERGPSAKH